MGKSSSKKPAAAGDLRRQSEERLEEKPVELPLLRKAEDTGRIVEELKIHQIELEMQNEELRRSRVELEKSRNNYAELYDFAPIGYFTFDRQGLIRAVNLAGALLLGVERDLLAEKQFSRFIADEEGKKIFSQHLATVLQREGMQRCEIGLRRKDDSVIHVQFQSVTLDKDGSKDGYILSSLVDGTAGKQLQAEVQEAREYAESIIETMRRPLLVLNADLKVVSANPSFYYTFKVTPEETIGNYFQELGSRQWDIPELLELLRESLNQNTGLNGYEVQGDFPAIGSRSILLNARWMHQKSNDADCIILAMEDVSERKRTEETLLKSGALQSAIFNSANFSSIATDAKGVIQIFNVGAEKMLGYTAADVMNKITPADISDSQELIARAEALSLEFGTPITPGFEALVFKASRGIEDIYELTYIRKDGSRFPAVVSVTALRDALNTIIGYLLIGTDNTARKRAEEELLKAGALQSAIFNSANFSSIATDAKGVIQIFNVGAEKMLGYAATDVMNKITPADISDPQEVIARAEVLSAEFGTPITPGFEALVFKASRGIEDIYELTYIRKDGSRFPAIVSVTALRDALNTIIGYLLIGTDNTARKRAEEELLKAGALQSAIFNSANFSSIATDAKGVIQIFNVGAERMLGYAATDVMNKITPADISDPQEVIARAEELSVELDTPITPGFEALVFKASRGIEDIYELTYIRKDGSRFPAVVSVTALRDEQDTIIGYLLIGTDNTARKMAEEALRKAGALQSAIFNSANFSSIATDAKGVIQIFNVGAERMLGYTAAEVMNKITPADISDPQEVIARAEELSTELGTSITPGFEALVFKASRGIEDIYELTYIRKDGSRFPAVVSVTALRDEQDAIIGYLLIGTDNTARKQIEAEQKQLSQRLRDHQFYTRSLFECNMDAIMTADPSGIITDVNKQMEVLTGCTRDELIGAPFKNYFTDPNRAETGVKLVLREKKVTNYELTARARDGKETVVSFNATTFYDRDRKLQGVFAAARDITERKGLDQVLLEKNVELENARSLAEKANLAKSDFLSSMSHELRSPLNAILGFAQLMESDSTPATPAQMESIAQILKAGWHLLTLINEILDLAKVESRQVPLSEEPVLLAEIMLECHGMIEPLAQQRGIQMTFPLFDKPCFVMADRTRLKQVLINLLSNAIKYNSEQGSVEVKYTESTPGRIRVSIRDTGVGLNPEQLAQLFQAFNRLGQEAGGEEGTGIGLVVAKRLVELMGGVVGVESTVGEGSVFWFELNAAVEPQLQLKEADTAALALPHAPRGARLHTVLYVEDNPANLKLVEQIIARHPDISLLTAVNGNSGIEIARASQPDVILMDINLPDINGFDAQKILRSDQATAHIPIIAISANAMPLDIERGLKAGFFRYITKPIKVNEFMEALDVALKHAQDGASIT